MGDAKSSAARVPGLGSRQSDTGGGRPPAASVHGRVRGQDGGTEIHADDTAAIVLTRVADASEAAIAQMAEVRQTVKTG
jgi:hypothetical protein